MRPRAESSRKSGHPTIANLRNYHIHIIYQLYHIKGIRYKEKERGFLPFFELYHQNKFLLQTTDFTYTYGKYSMI